MAEFDEADYRTSPTKVKAGGFVTELDDEQIWEWIDDANTIVSSRLVGTGLEDDTLVKIEKHLARHLIKFLVERQVDREVIGPITNEYSGDFGKSLKATSHGQTVLELDTSDTLGPDTGPEFELNAF